MFTSFWDFYVRFGKWLLFILFEQVADKSFLEELAGCCIDTFNVSFTATLPPQSTLGVCGRSGWGVELAVVFICL